MWPCPHFTHQSHTKCHSYRESHNPLIPLEASKSPEEALWDVESYNKMLHHSTHIGQNQCNTVFSYWYALVHASHTCAIGYAYLIKKFCVYKLFSLDLIKTIVSLHRHGLVHSWTNDHRPDQYIAGGVHRKSYHLSLRKWPMNTLTPPLSTKAKVINISIRHEVASLWALLV